MVAQIQKRVPIGIDATSALFYLNEGFRKLNQMAKGGFVWQLKQTTIGFGTTVSQDAPADFDAGKSAWMMGDAYTPTKTLIPYKPWSEFSTMQHLQTTQPGSFTAWTYVPHFTLTAPTSYLWTLKLAPADAVWIAPPPGPALPFVYHAVNFASFASGATTYFPTPDQFDSAIVDLAVAQAKQDYGLSGYDKIVAQVNNAIAEVIDTYRSDRFDLAGLFEMTAGAKEKATERDR